MTRELAHQSMVYALDKLKDIDPMEHDVIAYWAGQVEMYATYILVDQEPD